NGSAVGSPIIKHLHCPVLILLSFTFLYLSPSPFSFFFLVLSIQAISFQFTKEPKSQDALHGRSAMLRCEVSDPANITYIWFKDDSRLKNTERRFQEGSNLKFISVDRQLDAGNFSCRASNSATGELLLSTTASFNIKCEWLQPCQTCRSSIVSINVN
uniref:Ig-like domain-containing protein n=1 Tax=Cyprinodon variegatus TaxID=28743 RepID=A0A3Q2E1I3_CYPVA